MAKGKRYEVRPIEWHDVERYVIWDTVENEPAIGWYFSDPGHAAGTADNLNAERAES